MQIDHQCAHDLCNCRVDKVGKYCSDACETYANRDSSSKLGICECQHVDCGTLSPETPGRSGNQESSER